MDIDATLTKRNPLHNNHLGANVAESKQDRWHSIEALINHDPLRFSNAHIMHIQLHSMYNISMCNHISWSQNHPLSQRTKTDGSLLCTYQMNCSRMPLTFSYTYQLRTVREKSKSMIPCDMVNIGIQPGWMDGVYTNICLNVASNWIVSNDSTQLYWHIN